MVTIKNVSEDRNEQLIRRYMSLVQDCRHASRRVRTVLAFAVVSGGLAYVQATSPDVVRSECSIQPAALTSAMPCDTLTPMIKSAVPGLASGMALIALMPLMMRSHRANKDRDRFIKRFHF